MTISEAGAGPVVEVHDLVKDFRGKVRALDGVTFSCFKGEVLGILGPNGAGKTTLLHVLLGLTTPTSGSVGVLGMDLETRREEILQRVNFSSAYTSLPYNLSVHEALMVFANLYSCPDPHTRVAALLAQLDLESVSERLVGGLSAGQVSRLNLTKSLVNQPEVLFLDEPTASLDPDVADKVRRLLLKLRDDMGLTILYTSHNMREVEELCDRVLFMRKGRILVEGTPAQLLEKFGERRLEEVFMHLARDGSLFEKESEASGA